MNPHIPDLTGKKFYRWTVLSRAENMPGRGDTQWLCRCSCGTQKVVIGFTLKNGSNRSCGCYKKEITVKTHKRHGAYKDPLYKVWSAAKRRCNSPDDPSYKNYGGRGIKMSKEFQESFEAFRDHLGPKPSPAHTVDRINNNRGYKRGNLRWATRAEQIRNQRPRSINS